MAEVGGVGNELKEVGVVALWIVFVELSNEELLKELGEEEEAILKDYRLAIVRLDGWIDSAAHLDSELI